MERDNSLARAAMAAACSRSAAEKTSAAVPASALLPTAVVFAARALGISYSSLRRVLEADAAKDVSVQD